MNYYMILTGTLHNTYKHIISILYLNDFILQYYTITTHKEQDYHHTKTISYHTIHTTTLELNSKAIYPNQFNGDLALLLFVLEHLLFLHRWTWT